MPQDTEIRAELDAKELMRDVVVTVTIKRIGQLRSRLWLGAQLIRLAAWVMWMDVELTTDFGEEPAYVDAPGCWACRHVKAGSRCPICGLVKGAA